MYPVTEAFNAAITSSDVNMKARVVLRANGETYHLEHKDIQKDSLKVTYGVLPGDGIALGGVSGADLSITLTNDSGIFNHVQLNYAEIRPFVDVEISPGVFEPIPLGVFEVDTVDRMAVTFDRNFESIPLKAADRMVRFDLPFSEVDIPFPCSALHLLTAVCQRCGVPLGSTNFMNSGYVIQERPEGEISCRDIVSCIAEIAGSWAQCDRAGFLVLRWFKDPKFVQETVLDGNTDTAYGGNFTDDWYINTYDGGAFKADAPQVVFTSGMFYDFSIDDAPITITGVSLETEDKTYLVGSPRYVMSIDNPLIQTQIPEVLSSIHDKIAGFTYIPFHGVCLDNPAWEAGDMVLLDNIEGKSYRTILTGYEYVFDGRCNVIADGESDREHNFRPTSERKYSRLVKMIGKKQEQLNALDLAIINATNLIAGALGGHAIKGEGEYEGNYFVADHPDIKQATRVWRWNLGGFGYSENGVNGPYEVAITADKTIIANALLARIITGEMIKANTITADNLVAGTITGDKIKAGTITGDKLVAGTVEANKITTPNDDSIYGEIGQVGSTYGLRLMKLRENIGWYGVYPTNLNGFLIYKYGQSVMYASDSATGLNYNGNSIVDGNQYWTELSFEGRRAFRASSNSVQVHVPSSSLTGMDITPDNGVIFYRNNLTHGKNGSPPTGYKPYFQGGICTDFVPI